MAKGSTSRKTYRVASIPGDGIGNEVIPEGIRILEAAARVSGFDFRFDQYDFACIEYYEKHGRMMPADWEQTLSSYDEIFVGALDWPARVPDYVSLWGSLVPMRRECDQYVGLRPVRLMPGVTPPLAGRRHGDIDFVIVRENTEGEYGEVGGRIFEGTEREVVCQETIMTRIDVDRVMRFAFETALKRKKRLTLATKSNGIAISAPHWDERFTGMAASYPEVEAEQFHIDALTANFVLRPDHFDVVVGSNLFGDILSDLRPGPDWYDRHRTARQHQPGEVLPLLVRARARIGARHRRAGARRRTTSAAT